MSDKVSWMGRVFSADLPWLVFFDRTNPPLCSPASRFPRSPPFPPLILVIPRGLLVASGDGTEELWDGDSNPLEGYDFQTASRATFPISQVRSFLPFRDHQPLSSAVR